MSNCFENIKIENLNLCVNEELVSGTSETEVFAAIAMHVDKFPNLPKLGEDPSKVSLSDLATLKESITFKQGKGFFKLQAQTETGEVKDELVGNKGNKKVKSLYEFFLPNTTSRNIGFVRQYKNLGLILLVTEKSGRIRSLGTKSNPVFLETGTGTTGKAGEDDNGWQFTASVTTGSPAPIYSAQITFFDTKSASKIK